MHMRMFTDQSHIQHWASCEEVRSLAFALEQGGVKKTSNFNQAAGVFNVLTGSLLCTKGSIMAIRLQAAGRLNIY